LLWFGVKDVEQKDERALSVCHVKVEDAEQAGRRHPNPDNPGPSDDARPINAALTHACVYMEFSPCKVSIVYMYMFTMMVVCSVTKHAHCAI
jgi:hypothetical protein